MINEIKFPDSIKLLKSNGFRNIGLDFGALKNYSIEEVKQFIHENKVNPVSLEVAGILKKSYTAWVEDVRHGISVCSELGINKLLIIASPMGCDSFATSLLHLKKGLNEVLPLAEKNNITLLIEPLHPIYSHLSIFTKFSTALEFVKEIDHPCLGLVLDFFHVWWDSDIFSIIPQSIPYLGAVHISDWGKEKQNLLDRDLIGEGIIPISNLLKCINTSGYKGLYEIEILSDFWSSRKEDLLGIIREELEVLEEILL